MLGTQQIIYLFLCVLFNYNNSGYNLAKEQTSSGPLLLLLLLLLLMDKNCLAVQDGGDYSTERNGTERNGMMD